MILTAEQLDGEFLEEAALAEEMYNKVASLVKNLTKQQFDSSMSEFTKDSREKEARLRKAGVNVDAIKRKAAKAGEKAGAQMRGLRENAVSESQLSQTVQKHFLEVFTGIYSDLGNDGELEAGLVLFLIVLVANTFIAAILGAIGMAVTGSMTGVFVANAITGIFVAPITEETARRYAIKQGKGLSSLTLFINSFEFVSYVGQMIQMGIPVAAAVFIRTVLALFHQFLGALQKWGYLKDIAAGVDPEDAGTFEYYLAITIHALNNAFGGVVWKAIMPSLFGEDTAQQFDSDIILLNI